MSQSIKLLVRKPIQNLFARPPTPWIVFHGDGGGDRPSFVSQREHESVLCVSLCAWVCVGGVCCVSFVSNESHTSFQYAANAA